MMKNSPLIAIFIVFLVLSFGCNRTNNNKIESALSTDMLSTDENHFRISFGSCNKHDLEQPLWDDIISQKPDAWIWLGDIIYGDSENMGIIQAKYEKQSSHVWYAKLVESSQIFGIWDDHDYGKNNAGKEYAKKKETRDLLFEFLDVPKTNGAWQRDGAYQSYILEENDIVVKLILLDCRYFRDQDKRGGTGDILGEEQWHWFESELIKNEGDIHLIANGIQIIPEDHKYEKWSNFPAARKRLFQLIDSTQVNKPIFLSGDRHISELSAIDLENYDHPIYDITSSGLTHPWRSFSGEQNQHRIGEVVNVKNYASLIISTTASNTISVVYQVWGNHKTLLSEIELFPN